MSHLNAPNRFSAICADASLVLCATLPFLAFLDPVRNIDMQGFILLIAGTLAWITLLVRKQLPTWHEKTSWFAGLFLLSGLLSSLLHPHRYYDFLGAPYVRIGALSFVACYGCALLLRSIPTDKLVRNLYSIIVAAITVSLPYTVHEFGSLNRVSGIFSQADILACFAGVGWLLGLRLLAQGRWRRRIFIGQFVLGSVIVLTETRAVLLLVILLSGLMAWQRRGRFSKRHIMAALGTLLIVGLTFQFLPARVRNLPYAFESVTYRLSLQRYALPSAWHQPWLGYGPGNLADALPCKQLRSNALQKTCHQGYFFNSSHNIFLDRVLAVGWLGGLAYAALVLINIRRGSYAALLIVLYYFTNVTSVTLELLLWVLLLLPDSEPEKA